MTGRARRRRDDEVDRLPAQINERLTLIVAATAPALAGSILVTDWQVGLASVLVATAVLVVVLRVAIRPLAWLATQAAAQRDLAIAAGEAERSRLAADLHDGPLQDVLLLARRLDDAGDTDGASMPGRSATTCGTSLPTSGCRCSMTSA